MTMKDDVDANTRGQSDPCVLSIDDGEKINSLKLLIYVSVTNS